MECQAICLTGLQCSRKAEAGSLYCWQHRNYKGTSFVPIPNTRKKVEKKTEQKSPVRIATPPKIPVAPFLNSDEFKTLATSTVPKLGAEEGSTDYKSSALRNNIIANGPFTIELEVGEYEPTVMKYDLKFGEGNYTFEQVVDKIREFYDRGATHNDFFNLIRLSDANEDEVSRDLFKELQDESNEGGDIRLYDFMGSHIYIEGIVYDGLRNLYTLILGS